MFSVPVIIFEGGGNDPSSKVQDTFAFLVTASAMAAQSSVAKLQDSYPVQRHALTQRTDEPELAEIALYVVLCLSMRKEVANDFPVWLCGS